MAQFGQIHYTGVILKDFSPEGSWRVPPQLPRGCIRSALDPSQAQDDAVMRAEIQTEPLPVERR